MGGCVEGGGRGWLTGPQTVPSNLPQGADCRGARACVCAWEEGVCVCVCVCVCVADRAPDGAVVADGAHAHGGPRAGPARHVGQHAAAGARQAHTHTHTHTHTRCALLDRDGPTRSRARTIASKRRLRRAAPPARLRRAACPLAPRRLPASPLARKHRSACAVLHAPRRSRRAVAAEDRHMSVGRDYRSLHPIERDAVELDHRAVRHGTG